MSRRPAVFIDRDGTILNERGYLSDPKKIRFYAAAFDGLRRLQKAGYKLVVVTNQSGVGRGYFSLAQLGRIHRRFKQMLSAKGVRLAGIYFCPHLPDAGCSCRKPKPGLIRKAVKELSLDVKRSYVIGDQTRDVQLAHRAGACGNLVLTGAGRESRKKVVGAVHIASNLAAAAKWIVREK